MATAAPNAGLPMLYNQLEPLNSAAHSKFKIRRMAGIKQLGQTHAIPLTIDEFALAQRHYPIIFSVGDDPVPLALMALNEGMNTFIGEDGRMTDATVYVPAYLRRYPFMLARLNENSDELSLCFDPSSDALAEDADGEALFDGDQPSAATQAVLQFCEQFETAGQRTSLFMSELTKSGLLMDGEVAIQPEGSDQPFIYRGFQMVDEDKLRELRGDELRKMNQNGLLPLVYAHLFSLAQIREVFARQVQQGKGPIPLADAPTGEANGAAPAPANA